jgi:tetratricopeptide (TPR) repeat protein
MKTERRHELQKNELADWLTVRLGQARNYSGPIWVTVLAIVVLVAVGMYMSRRSTNQTAAAWEELFSASGSDNPEKLQSLADRMPDTRAGKWARMRLADRSLTQGIDQLFQDRAEARKSLASAVDGYRWLREHSGDKQLEERATLGLAKAYESQDKLQESRQEYEKLLKQWPEGVYADEAKSRLHDLDKKSTREFYDWFAQREMKPPGDNGPGIPGLKPKFESGNLPADAPEIQFHQSSQAPGNEKGSGPALTPTQQFDKLRTRTVNPDAEPPTAAGKAPPTAAESPAKPAAVPAKAAAAPAAPEPAKPSGNNP